MRFARTSQWAETSLCNRYSVAAMKHGDSYTHQAWHIGKVGELLYTGTPEQCRQACIDHAAGINVAPEVYQPGSGGGR